MDARLRQIVTEQLRAQDEQIVRLHAENRELRQIIKNLQAENLETFEALKSICKQLHDTRKALLPGY